MDYRKSNMVQDSIQLGVTKKPQGKSLSCAKLRGFFYAGRRVGNAISYGCISLAERQNAEICYKRYAGRGKYDSVYEVHHYVPPVIQAGKNPAPAAPNYNFYDNPSRKRDIL